MNSVFRRSLKYISRQARIVYRLIDATLIGNFFRGPFLFRIEIFANVVHGPRFAA